MTQPFIDAKSLPHLVEVPSTFRARLTFALIERGRPIEWVSSSVLLFFAITLWLPGDTLAADSFAAFRRLGISEVTLAVPLMLVASARMTALYINGRWEPGTPILRKRGAQVGVYIFAGLAVLFGWPYVGDFFGSLGSWLSGHGWVEMTLAPSTGAGTYTILAAADVLAVYRASLDQERAQHRRAS